MKIAAGFRDQQACIRRVRLDLLAQPVNVGFQRMGRHASIISPDFVQKDVARDNAFGCPVQELQNVGLFLGQPNFAVFLGDQHLHRWLERVWSKRENRVL